MRPTSEPSLHDRPKRYTATSEISSNLIFAPRQIPTIRASAITTRTMRPNDDIRLDVAAGDGCCGSVGVGAEDGLETTAVGADC